MTDWEALYQIGDTPWDKGAPAPPLLEWLERTPRSPSPAGRVLVPGCGMGHDVRAISSACAAAEVLGLDLSPSAVDRATALGGSFRLDDFFALPASTHGAFDWIFEHTCFCAIDPLLRPAYAGAAAKVLRPGGWLLAVFYLNPRDPGEREEGPPYRVTLEELDRLFAPGFDLVEDYVPTRSYPGREGRERLRLYRKRADSGV